MDLADIFEPSYIGLEPYHTIHMRLYIYLFPHVQQFNAVFWPARFRYFLVVLAGFYLHPRKDSILRVEVSLGEVAKCFAAKCSGDYPPVSTCICSKPLLLRQLGSDCQFQSLLPRTTGMRMPVCVRT